MVIRVLSDRQTGASRCTDTRYPIGLPNSAPTRKKSDTFGLVSEADCVESIHQGVPIALNTPSARRLSHRSSRVCGIYALSSAVNVQCAFDQVVQLHPIQARAARYDPAPLVLRTET